MEGLQNSTDSLLLTHSLKIITKMCNFKAIMILAHDSSLSNKILPVNSSTYCTLVNPTIHYIDSLTFLVEYSTVATKAFYKCRI